MKRKPAAEQVSEPSNENHPETETQEANAEAPAAENENGVESKEASELDKALAQALAQIEEYKQALQRERADFINYKKRVERENESFKAKISGDVLAKFLPIADDFERALNSVPQAEKDTDWMSGIILIHRKFESLIESAGVKVIDPLGEPFDPQFHEAIGTDEADETYASGQVSAVLQRGYVLGERVLRTAMVRVAD